MIDSVACCSSLDIMVEMFVTSSLMGAIHTELCIASASSSVLTREAHARRSVISCGAMRPLMTEELAVAGSWYQDRVVSDAEDHHKAVPGCRVRGVKTSIVSSILVRTSRGGRCGMLEPSSSRIRPCGLMREVFGERRTGMRASARVERSCCSAEQEDACRSVARGYARTMDSRYCASRERSLGEVWY